MFFSYEVIVWVSLFVRLFLFKKVEMIDIVKSSRNRCEINRLLFVSDVRILFGFVWVLGLRNSSGIRIVIVYYFVDIVLLVVLIRICVRKFGNIVVI